jgi:hypothetical protein
MLRFWKSSGGSSFDASARSNSLKPILVVVFAMVFVTLIVAPVGLSMMGLIEEWDIYYLFHKHGAFYITDAVSPLPTHRLRPLTLVPFTIGYVLSPNSFFALNILQVISLILKVIGMAAIINWCTANRLLAMFAGIIFLAYPADTMQMTLRSVHINWAIALTVGGVALILDATTRPTRLARLTEATIAAALFLAGSLIYEAGLFLAPVPILLWWARFGMRKGWPRMKLRIDVVAIWALFCAVAAAYVVVVSLTGSNYQMEVTGDHKTIAKDLILRLPLLFTIAMYRLFLHGWFDGIQMLSRHLDFWPWLVAVVALAGAIVRLFPGRSEERPSEWSQFARLATAGVLAAVLGYLPYLTSMAHIMTSQRTYLYAAVGATIAVVALLRLLLRFAPAMAAMLTLFCLLSGLGSQWEQLAQYTALSNRQRMILAGIAEAAPNAGQPGSKRLLIRDRSGTMSNVWMLRGFELHNALTLMYGREIDPLVCTEPAGVFSSFLTDPTGRSPRCQETASSWVAGIGLPKPTEVEETNIDLLTVEPDGRVAASGSRSPPSAEDQTRWREFLGCWPASDCMHDIQKTTSASFDYEFGRWWGLDDVPWGSGWREEEWKLPSLDPPSWSWISAPDTNLWFKINPVSGRYTFRMKAFTWMPGEPKDSLTVHLNGTALNAIWSGGIFQADFEGSLLKQGLNEIRFRSVVSPLNGLSVAVDRVSIEPAGQN